MPRNQLLSKADMDFNSNDEYLKAFPPNFGPKLQGRNMLNQLPVSDFQFQKVLSENQQMPEPAPKPAPEPAPEPACLYEELDCVEVQEPIQVHIPVYNAEDKGDEILKAQELFTLCKDKSSLVQPEIIEPMPQVVDTTPVMEVQRDSEMVRGESHGEPSELSVETALSVQAIETRAFDGETLSDTQAEGPPSGVEITQETTVHCEIPAEDVITIGVIKDSLLAVDNLFHSKAEKSVLVEAIEAATTKDEAFGLPTLRDFVKGTQVLVDHERPVTDIGTVEGNVMDAETLQEVQNEQPARTLGQIEFVEDTMTTPLETSENADAIAQIKTKDPITLEMIKTTTIRATYETQTSPNALTEHTQIDSVVLGTEDATMALEMAEKTTMKAKAVCLFAKNGVPSASNSTTGLEGTCSGADVDKIVDSIMNDIADIEADMEVEKEADTESNAQHQELEICGKSIPMESTAICHDYIESMGSHV